MESTIPLILTSKNVIEKTNIYSGSYELIESNSILYFENDSPLEIEETVNSSFKLLIRFIHEKDDSGKHNLQFKVNTETNVIEYKCINFNNPLGTGTSKPIEICTIGGKKVYIHFWIYMLGGKNVFSRKMDYSLWKER